MEGQRLLPAAKLAAIGSPGLSSHGDPTESSLGSEISSRRSIGGSRSGSSVLNRLRGMTGSHPAADASARGLETSTCDPKARNGVDAGGPISRYFAIEAGETRSPAREVDEHDDQAPISPGSPRPTRHCPRRSPDAPGRPPCPVTFEVKIRSRLNRSPAGPSGVGTFSRSGSMLVPLLDGAEHPVDPFRGVERGPGRRGSRRPRPRPVRSRSRSGRRPTAFIPAFLAETIPARLSSKTRQVSASRGWPVRAALAEGGEGQEIAQGVGLAPDRVLGRDDRRDPVAHAHLADPRHTRSRAGGRPN